MFSAESIMPNKDDLLPPPSPPLLDLNIIGVNLSANTERLFSEGWMDLLQFSNACVGCCEGRCIYTKLKKGGKKQLLGECTDNLPWPGKHNTNCLTHVKWQKTNKLGWNFHQCHWKHSKITACSTAETHYLGFVGNIKSFRHYNCDLLLSPIVIRAL